MNGILVGICFLICRFVTPSCKNPISDSRVGGTIGVKEIVRDVENAKSRWQPTDKTGCADTKLQVCQTIGFVLVNSDPLEQTGWATDELTEQKVTGAGLIREILLFVPREH